MTTQSDDSRAVRLTGIAGLLGAICWTLGDALLICGNAWSPLWLGGAAFNIGCLFAYGLSTAPLWHGGRSLSEPMFVPSTPTQNV
jgi:hypothetical protein